MMALNEDLNQLEASGIRAKKALRNMGRSLASDRFHLFLVACITLQCIVFLVIVTVALGAWTQE